MSNFYEDYVIKSHPTGSNYICNPPVTDTDIDTVILAKPGYEQSLIDLGWEYQAAGETYAHNGDFISWRKENKNYIVTSIPLFFKKFVIATKAAKAVNAKYKPARIALFQAIFNADIDVDIPTINNLDAPF